MKRDHFSRFESPRLCSVAAAIVGTALVGGVVSADASRHAANTQADAANRASAQQLASGQQASQQDLGAIKGIDQYFQPYMNLGEQANTELGSRMGALTANFNPTQAQLASMPGYQFELQQGLEAAQNGFAARGLGTSGAAMKGAANYAQGLASQNWQADANMFWNNQNNAFNKLSGMSANGQNAATSAASANTNLIQASGNALTGQSNAAANSQMFGAQASAAGTMGQANAISNGMQGGINNYLAYKYVTTPNGYGANRGLGGHP